MRTYFLITCCLIYFSQFVFAQANEKNRVIILSDIEADPDDTQSFVRMFLYSNEIDIVGAIRVIAICICIEW